MFSSYIIDNIKYVLACDKITFQKIDWVYNIDGTTKLLLENEKKNNVHGILIFNIALTCSGDNKPLIIDQPEDNLDNQSVYKILVPFIKEAKNRRQIIIVTHNPNLAVVCDAEQVINVRIDKADANKVHITAGAIENLKINNKLVEILEGTLPAFNNRDLKYSITKENRGVN